VTGTELGRRIGRSVPASLRVPAPAGSHELVRLTTRLVLAQAGIAAAVGLPFSRRQTSLIAMTLTLVAAVCVLAAVARAGTPTARNVVLFFEVFIVLIGLYQFFFDRYLGGTLFAIVITGVLLHPAVARAYGVLPRRSGSGTETIRGESGGTLGGAGTLTYGEHGGDR
jgi:hypothetical protein